MTQATVTPITAARTPRKAHNTNKGKKFHPDPITVQEFAKLLAACRPTRNGWQYAMSAARMRAMMVVLFRTGVRVSELIAFTETDLNRDDQSLLVRSGKGGKRRLVLMDVWGWKELEHWLKLREQLPPGALFPVLLGSTAGEPMEPGDVRRQFKVAGERAGIRKRVPPHQWRHGFSVSFMRDTKDLIALQRQLGHSSPTVTGVYLRGVGDLLALEPIALRPPPMVMITPAPDLLAA